MMKRKIFISFAILLVLSLFASAKVIEVPDATAFMFVSGKPPAGGSSCPDGYECFEDTGWPTNYSGSGDPDNTTNPIEGSEDVYIDGSQTMIIDPNYNASEHWWQFVVQNVATVQVYANNIGLLIRDTGGAFVYVSFGQYVSGSYYASTVKKYGFFSSSYPTNIKVYAKKSDAGLSNGIARTWLWDEVNSAWKIVYEVTNRPGENNIDNLYFNGTTNYKMHYDVLTDSSSDITSPGDDYNGANVYTEVFGELYIGSNYMKLGYDSSNTYTAQCFQAGRTDTIREVVFSTGEIGDISSYTYDFSIYSDTVGTSCNSPNSAIQTISNADGAEIGAGGYNFHFPTAVSVTSGTYYWVVFHADTVDASNYAKVYYDGSTNNGQPVKNSSDGSSWSSVDSSARARFIVYYD